MQAIPKGVQRLPSGGHCHGMLTWWFRVRFCHCRPIYQTSCFRLVATLFLATRFTYTLFMKEAVGKGQIYLDFATTFWFLPILTESLRAKQRYWQPTYADNVGVTVVILTSNPWIIICSWLSFHSFRRRVCQFSENIHSDLCSITWCTLNYNKLLG